MARGGLFGHNTFAPLRLCVMIFSHTKTRRAIGEALSDRKARLAGLSEDQSLRRGVASSSLRVFV